MWDGNIHECRCQDISWHQMFLELELRVVVTDCCGCWELNEPGLSGRVVHWEPFLQRYWMHLDYGFYFGLWLDYIVLIFCYFSILQFYLFCYIFTLQGKCTCTIIHCGSERSWFSSSTIQVLGLILGGQAWCLLPAGLPYQPFCVLFNNTGIELRALSICFAVKLYPQPSFSKKNVL